MAEPVRVVHYLNQFFGGIGGESEAQTPPVIRREAVGPGNVLAGELGDGFAIVRTVICGDNYFTDHADEVLAVVAEVAREADAQLFVAGPAFNAGRYGLACARTSAWLQDRSGMPALTAMYRENPAAEMFRAQVLMAETSETAAGMRQALERIAHLARKLAQGEELGPAKVEHYLPRGVRKAVRVEAPAAARAVAMLTARLAGEPFETELEVGEHFEPVPPARPLRSIQSATIALVTEGGLVPKGNPDRIPTGRASHWAKYGLGDLQELPTGGYECSHGGIDSTFANEDPNRMVPLDVARELESAGAFGTLLDEYYVTTGNGGQMEEMARIGTEIGAELTDRGVDGVIMTAT
jgi:glycine reductase